MRLQVSSDGSLLCVAHPVFHLREALLDRVQVGAVGAGASDVRDLSIVAGSPLLREGKVAGIDEAEALADADRVADRFRRAMSEIDAATGRRTDPARA